MTDKTDANRSSFNSVGQAFVLLPAGKFLQGSTPLQIEQALAWKAAWQDAESARKDFEVEMPQREVTLTKPFHIAIHQTTVGQFREFIKATDHIPESIHSGRGGAYYQGGKMQESVDITWERPVPEFIAPDNEPVTQVTWNDAAAYCAWLSSKEGKTYRLPTEAEWEYACRAGTSTHWPHGDDPEPIHEFAVCNQPAPAAVGTKKPNPFGIHDMVGNVWELCSDYGDPGAYKGGPATDPTGPPAGVGRVRRGGAFNVALGQTRSAYRKWSVPNYRGRIVGFRIVCEA